MKTNCWAMGEGESCLFRNWNQFGFDKGKYPESLTELGTELPHDVFTGESYYYVHESEGRYRIYGVGWNLKDDGGEANAEKSQSGKLSDKEPLDLIWQNFPVSFSDQ